MSEQMNLEEMWQQVQEKLVAEDTNRSVWDAARVAVPLALEEEVLALGFTPANMKHASYLTSTLNKPKVQNAIEKVLGRRVNVVTVEGATVEAWKQEKGREAHRAESAAAQLRERVAAAGTEAIWQELYDEIGNTFRSVRDRTFPLSRGKMVATALRQLLDSEKHAHDEDPEGTDVHNKAINRAIDRIAALAEMPATTVAIEYLRMRGAKR